MSAILDAKTPSGPLDQQWSKHKRDSKLINPANVAWALYVVIDRQLNDA